MAEIDTLLQNNRAWAERVEREQPDFFSKLAEGQRPRYLWIGCADSRVPETTITGTHPGDMFVHRNIANMVVHADLNMLGVLQYAVEVLGVEDVIICGHYGCGGVRAAMGAQHLGVIDDWLRRIKDVFQKHRAELEAIADDKQRWDRFVEINVAEQVRDLCETSIVQRAWRERGGPRVHGWVFDLASGRIRDLGVTISGPEGIDPIYRFDFDS